MGLGFNQQDASLRKTAALPNGAAATQIAALDLMNGVRGDFVADCELVVDAPILTTAELPDGQTVQYTVETDDNDAFGSPTVIATLGTQTGAGGAGAAAVTYRYRFPTNVERYARVKATKTGAANASTKSMVAGVRF